MVRQILQQCLTCSAWSLSTTCPACGKNAQAAAPLKWSPEDHRADIRRKMYNVEDPSWAQNLPTLPSLEEMRESATIKAADEEE